MFSNNQLQNKWLACEDVCRLLMISKRTLQTYHDRGILPFAQIGRNKDLCNDDNEAMMASSIQSLKTIIGYLVQLNFKISITTENQQC